MGKYKLNYASLKSLDEDEVITFTSTAKRRNWIINKTIGIYPRRVFVLIVKYSETSRDIYVFHDFHCITDVSKFSWELYLYEFESYKDAYGFALTLREDSELCYNNNDLNN